MLSPFLVIVDAVAQAHDRRNQYSPRGVAERHDQQIAERMNRPDVGHGEIKHICHAMLKAAQNEYGHAEEQADVFADLMRIALISVHRDIHQDIAQYGEQKNACEIIGQLDFTHGGRALRNACDTRRAYGIADGGTAREIAQPNDAERGQSARALIEHEPNLAGKQRKAEADDGKQPDGEQQCADNLVLYREIDHTANGDAHTGEQRV